MSAQNWVMLGVALVAMYGALLFAGFWVFKLSWRQLSEPQASSPRRTR